jgi:hypothetical protein
MVSRKLVAAILSGFAAILSLFFTLSAFASGNGASVPATTAQDREATAQRFVQRELEIWQDRLDLKDWDVKVELVRPNALEPKTLGNVHWDSDVKKATISVLSAYDYNMPMQAMLDDMEVTIVHELVHLHLSSLPRSDATSRNEEHVVVELTRALLKLEKR